MNYITKKHLSRRHFLRGAGGVAVALPLLESMLPASSAWAQAAATPKSRFAAFYIPHGKTMAKWTPATEGKNFEMSEILKPMEPFRDYLTVISGLRLTSGYGGDASAAASHGRSSATFLTCAQETAPNVMAVSMDQVLAQKMGQDTPLPSMELTLEDSRTMSWANATTPLPLQINPKPVFEKMFGLGTTQAERVARRTQATSMLDSVMSDLGALRRDLPASDIARMDQYTTEVREVERRITLAGRLPDGFVVPARPNGIPPDFESHLKAMFDLMVLAWQAEITRVSTLMIAKEISGTVYPNSGVSDAFHNLSHHANLQVNKDRFAVLNTYHMSQVAYFFDKLKATPDGDGTLLDHSLTLYSSGIADGNKHDHDPLPAAVIGGASGRMEGNRHIVVPAMTPFANLHVALMNKVGVETQSFADSNGVLSI